MKKFFLLFLTISFFFKASEDLSKKEEVVVTEAETVPQPSLPSPPPPPPPAQPPSNENLIRIAPITKSRRSASLESIPTNLQACASPANPPTINKYETVASSRIINRPSLLTNATNTYQTESSGGGEQTAAQHSRLRAVNRSFRTAVDKSFDLPANPGDSATISSKPPPSLFKLSFFVTLISPLWF